MPKHQKHSQLIKNTLTNAIVEKASSNADSVKELMHRGFKGYNSMDLEEITNIFINMFGWKKYGETISNLKNEKKYIAYFDASFVNQTGEGFVSYVIKTEYNELIIRDAFEVSIKNAHVGEQLALLRLLDKTLELGIDNIEIYGDNQPMINKLHIRKGGLKGFNGYLPAIVNRIEKFDKLSLAWNSRDNNKYADMLCRLKRRGVNLTKRGGEFNFKELQDMSAEIGQKKVV